MRCLFIPLFALALCGCGTTPTVPVNKPANSTLDHASFRGCVDREAPIAFANAMKTDPISTRYGYRVEVDNALIAACRAALGNSTSPSNADVSYVNSAIEALANATAAQWEQQEVEQLKKEDATATENEKIQERAEDLASKAYYACLAQHARTLALVSTETADVVAQAALSSCSAERMNLVGTVNRYVPSIGYEVAAGLDASFTKSLLLEIVKARATQTTPPKPPSAPHNTPI